MITNAALIVFVDSIAEQLQLHRSQAVVEFDLTAIHDLGAVMAAYPEHCQLRVFDRGFGPDPGLTTNVVDQHLPRQLRHKRRVDVLSLLAHRNQHAPLVDGEPIYVPRPLPKVDPTDLQIDIRIKSTALISFAARQIARVNAQHEVLASHMRRQRSSGDTPPAIA